MTEFVRENVPVTFVGQLPPPITGMNLMTEVVVRALESKTTVRRFGWTSRQPITRLSGFRARFSRLISYAKSAVRLLFSSPSKGEFVYLPANSNWGMVYDIVVASIARLRGFRIALHHHSYTYLDRYDWRMAAINKLVTRKGIHVVHCRKMEDDFRSRYNSSADFMWVTPAIVSSRPETTVNARLRFDDRSVRRFTLGLLSNLSVAKGLVTAINTLEFLLAAELEVRLILAGPCMSSEVQEIVDKAKMRLADRIEYRGPVYDEDKVSFLADIDAFIFPTQFKCESWGIVLTEAMAAGRPVIAFDRGCISWIVSNGSGRVVARDGEFEKEASELIKKWITEPQEYWQACEGALHQVAILEEVARQELDAFTDFLVGGQ